MTTPRTMFERIYDLPERVLPAATLAAPTPPEAKAKRALNAHAACALGVDTDACRRDYFQLRAAAALKRLM
jgi:uncharacterized protein YcaQ